MEPFAENVVVLVGASRGIGEQMAYILAERGARLVLAARSGEQLEKVALECRKIGTVAITVVIDVADESSCLRLMRQAVCRFGRIDTLLYNAGSGSTGRFENMPDLSPARKEVDTNYLGLVYCAYHALPYLKKSRGRIVGVASMGALVGIPGTATYNSSKHALRGFLNTLRAENRGTGLSVTVVYLGAVRTDAFLDQVGENAGKVPSISPGRAAGIIIRAAASRRRSVIPTLGSKLLVFFYTLMPALADRLLARLVTIYDK